MRGRPKDDALIGIGKLEALARGYASTAKTLQKLARSLRKVTEEVGRHVEASDAPKGRPRAKKGHSTAAPQPPKRKGMSAEARKKLSQLAKIRWAEKRAAAHKPNGQTKKPAKESVPEGNAA